jgi:hypothetical protein
MNCKEIGKVFGRLKQLEIGELHLDLKMVMLMT